MSHGVLVEPIWGQSQNPWAEVPAAAPYIAEADRELLGIVQAHEPGGRTDLHFEVSPHPHTGDPARARVVVLSLNPGWAETDLVEEETIPEWRAELRRNLLFRASTPFLYVDPRFRSATGAGRWWSRRLKGLAEATSWEVIGDRMLCLEFFGYHSVGYQTLPFPLPTQRFEFEVLRQLMKNGALVVVTRAWSQWVWNVPELYAYPNVVRLNSKRWVGLSSGNMPTESFGRLVASLS